MTYEEIRQQLKNEALNKIIFIHSKYYKYELVDDLDDDYYGGNITSCDEERDKAVKSVLDNLEYKLKQLKNKKNEIQLRKKCY